MFRVALLLLTVALACGAEGDGTNDLTEGSESSDDAAVVAAEVVDPCVSVCEQRYLCEQVPPETAACAAFCEDVGRQLPASCVSAYVAVSACYLDAPCWKLDAEATCADERATLLACL